MPGMRMSSTTTSGFVLATSEMAWLPFIASPTTSNSPDSSSELRTLSRMSRWSSARTTRALSLRMVVIALILPEGSDRETRKSASSVPVWAARYPGRAVSERREQARIASALRVAVGLVAILLVSLALTTERASAATGTGSTAVFTSSTSTTTTSVPPPTRLTAAEATRIFLQTHKVATWLERYPSSVGTNASFANGSWTVNVYYGAAGEIATGKVDDATSAVSQAWTGPQVAWGMARGGTGFGGKTINSYSTWLAFCAVFLLVLVDWRRPFSVRNFDLLALLSLSASLWFFNRGNVFAAMPLVYPVFAWLIGRCLWVARRDRAFARLGGVADLGDRRRHPRPGRRPGRHRRQSLERHRRGALGRHRRKPDRPLPEPLRNVPGRAGPSALRPGGLQRRDTRTTSRPTGAARRPTPRETPTGRSPTGPISRPTSCSGGVGCGTACQLRTRPRSSGI